MKKAIAWVVFGLLACGQGFAQELLVDPGMNAIGPNGQLGNTPNPPWVVTAARGANLAFDDGAASEAFADVDGGGFGLFYKAFVGNPPWDPTAGDVDASIYQDVAGTAGKKYTLTGWWGAEDNYSGLNTAGANTIFALDFLGGGGGLIGSAELDLEAAGLGDPANAGLNYEQFTVMATAPAGTQTVRARGTMIDGAFFQDPGQALVTDSWSLTAVPEPTSLVIGCLGILSLMGLRRRQG
jgi:hypothetical protein